MLEQKIPISTKYLLIDKKISFDLFLYINKHFIKYANKDAFLNIEKINKIKQHKDFFVSSSDILNLNSYLELENLTSVEKEALESSILKNSTHVIINEMFTNQTVTNNDISNSKVVVKSIVDKITNDPKSLINILNLLKHDYYTYNHSLDVSAYTITFTNQLFIEGIIKDKNLIELYGHGGFLHDIGKRKVPISIINKAGPLDSKEWTIMKNHTIYGYEILKNLNIKEKEIIEASLFHHEHFDGSGYPMSISSEKIPLVAKIVSICDVFDALTTKRPYAGVMDPDEALRLMKHEMKGKFSQNLIQTFEKSVFNIITPTIRANQKSLDL